MYTFLLLKLDFYTYKMQCMWLLPTTPSAQSFIRRKSKLKKNNVPMKLLCRLRKTKIASQKQQHNSTITKKKGGNFVTAKVEASYTNPNTKTVSL